MTIENLSGCVHICKFCELHDKGYQQIFQKWLMVGAHKKNNAKFHPVYVKHNLHFCLI